MEDYVINILLFFDEFQQVMHLCGAVEFRLFLVNTQLDQHGFHSPLQLLHLKTTRGFPK